MSVPEAKPGFASEAAHWYRKDGEACHTVIGANKKERPTTLRDARKLGLLPSVTSILKLSAKPGLERWKAEQVLLAGLTLPMKPGEKETEWIKRVWEDSQEQAAKAAERGTEIHAAIEKSFRGDPVDPAMKPWVDAAWHEVQKRFPDDRGWSPERSFANTEHRFGGKCDLHRPGITGVVIDFKGKEGPLEDISLYDEHHMQLAAYAVGLGMDPGHAEGFICFVRRDLPEARMVGPIPPEWMLRGWAMFRALLGFFYAKTNL